VILKFSGVIKVFSRYFQVVYDIYQEFLGSFQRILRYFLDILQVEAPNPIRIIHHGDSSKEDVGKEILGLTKLNWNTTSFSTFLPITIRFTDEVGKILSKLKDDTEL